MELKKQGMFCFLMFNLLNKNLFFSRRKVKQALHAKNIILESKRKINTST